MVSLIKRLFLSSREASHLTSGKWGEKRAVKFLKAAHYKIISQREFVGRHDEIDIIAQQNRTLVFVEVKTRKDETYGRPASAVNAKKRKNISRAAVNYLRKKKIKPDYIRFDIIEVIGEPGADKPEIRHIENAFQLDDSVKLWW